MPEISEQLSYELRIGVTGHRNLSRQAAVAEAVDRLVDRLDKLMGHNKNLPLEWIVISPLAKGADRIVARSILNKEHARLKVLSPFSLNEYRKDFTNPEDLKEFNELLKKADPPVEELGKNTSDLTKFQRSAGYLRVGREVVDACEILIAIWDGKPAEGQGGTAEIVSYALERGRTVLRIDAENPTAPVKLLLALKNEGEQERSLDFQELTLPDTARKLSLNYHQFMEFCSNPSLPKEKLNDLTEQCRQEVKKVADKAKLDPARLKPIIDYLIPTYARADALAAHYQKWHFWLSIVIHILSALAVSIAVFQVILFPQLIGLIWLEVIAMLIVLLMSSRNSWHENWIDYRFLAEQLRTAIFTGVLELNALSGPANAPKTMPFYNKPKNWIEFTIASLIQKVLRHPCSTADFSVLKEFVIEGWLDDQRKWHMKNAHTKKHTEDQLRGTVLFFFWGTLLMALFHLSEIGHEHSAATNKILSWMRTLGTLFAIPFEIATTNKILSLMSKCSTVLAIALPAWGAAIHAISKQLEYDRVAERSEKMAGELGRLVTLAKESDNLNDLREIIQQAIRTVNLENYEWWALISFNPPELVA